MRRLKDIPADEMAEVIDELSSVARHCGAANWDGYGAAPVAEQTYEQARSFLDALPSGTPVPSVGVEADGHLTLEWYRSPRRLLSVSITPEGDLHYAALIGPARAYGTERFLGETPPPILDLIRRIAA
jgi:hypothetical protein